MRFSSYKVGGAIIALTIILGLISKSSKADATLSVSPIISNYSDMLMMPIKNSKINDYGIKSVTATQEGDHFLVKVVHNPYKAFRFLVDTTLKQGRRTNGLNFQNVFTLNMVNEYCKIGLFSSMEKNGIQGLVNIKYEDGKGRFIAFHKATKSLCFI